MKALKIIGLVVLVLATSVFTYLGFYGLFEPVKFQREILPEEVMVYRPMLGDYGNSRTVMDGVYQTLLKNYGVDTKRGCGIYLDKPGSMPKAEMRSYIGCLVPAEVVAQLKDVDSLKVFRFEKRECLLARFPFKGPGSILVGMLKAYPALEEYMNVNKVKPKPVMELYDGVNNQIEYRLVEDLELP